MCSGIHAIPSGPGEFPEAVYSFVVCDKMNVMIDAGVANSVMDASFLDKLDYVVVTHLHIDHVGALSEIVQRYKSRVIVYQGYSKYLRDPTKINRDAKLVLGEVADIYGEVTPTEANFLEVKGGEEIDLGERKMKIIYTPGHARHHISVIIDGILYSGDSAGGRYNGVPIPTTPPPLDLKSYLESLRLQISLYPRAVGLAHGGLVSPSHLQEHLNQILSRNYKVNVDLGGIAEQILSKHLEVNYKGLEEAYSSLDSSSNP
ncbi:MULTISPECIES: MBL fold metallo-hydrolase [Metallosphaera]|uniref:MBL fold metallo-hydrolase n=1 Tax=Metallosphaera TaxID=41980 RepID=UPI001F06B02B|nr:MBL fold metallo-hydrolase [Metallosphaera sedula]MCH1770165.1 MBL fold metallo-hydrolase [Metallosphaera sedula]MCP6728001.1 MBL fold metallo-hydrolase [Metallosphaera sedula]